MAHELASMLAADVDNVTYALLGEPSFRSPDEFRYGRHGSFAIVRRGPKRGLCFDFESGEGGDLIWLVMRVHGVDFRRALEIARQFVGDRQVQYRPPPKHDRAPPEAADELRRRQAFALARWYKRKNYRGSPAQRYLLTRGLDVRHIDLDHVLGWDSETSAILALMTDPVTATPCGIHRTFLDRDCRKLGRKMLGKQGVIRISPDEEVRDAIGICEGIEDALAIVLCHWKPVWAATSAGAIARFPLLCGIQSITIFADCDPAGLEAARRCCTRWADAGREVAIVKPGE